MTDPAVPSDPSGLSSDVPSDLPNDPPSDLPPDVSSDLPNDPPSDLPPDVSSDLPNDPPSDLPPVVSSDLPNDPPSDLPPVVSSDLPNGPPSDLPPDVSSDLPNDPPSDLPPVVSSDLPNDPPSGLPPHVSSDLPNDPPSDLPPDLPSESATSADESTSDSMLAPDVTADDRPLRAPTDLPAEPCSDAAAAADGFSELADPVMYDATRAAVDAVLDHAVRLLESDAPTAAVSVAARLLRQVLAAARRHVETAAACARRLPPLGVRLCQHVLTVADWRRVELRARHLAQRAIRRAVGQLSLAPHMAAARHLVDLLRSRPPLEWAERALAEAAAELGSVRPPADYAGRQPDRDAAAAAEEALVRAYRAVHRARQTEPVPAVALAAIGEWESRRGLATVHDVVRTWRYAVRWRYCVDFLRTAEESLQTSHYYQVRFSIPEPHQPIPKAVAYVFFCLTVSKVKPPSSPIEVFYTIETSRMQHTPGKTSFQEKWLIDVVNAKLKLWRDIKF